MIYYAVFLLHHYYYFQNNFHTCLLYIQGVTLKYNLIISYTLYSKRELFHELNTDVENNSLDVIPANKCKHIIFNPNKH